MFNSYVKHVLQNTYNFDKHFGASGLGTDYLFCLICGFFVIICGCILIYSFCSKSEDISNLSIIWAACTFIGMISLCLSLSAKTDVYLNKTYQFNNGFVQEYNLSENAGNQEEYVYKVYKYSPLHDGIRTKEFQKQFISKDKVYLDKSIIK